MKKRDLLKDLELCNKATPGPWSPCLGSGNILCTGVMSEAVKEKHLIADFLPDYFFTEGFADAIEDHRPNMNFVAEAREGWPYAIKRAMKAEDLLNKILPMAMWESCEYWEDKEADPTTHCCDWNEVVEQIRRVLGLEKGA